MIETSDQKVKHELDYIPTFDSIKPKQVPNVEITLKSNAVNDIPEFYVPESPKNSDMDDS